MNQQHVQRSQAKKTKQKGRQLGGLDASLVVWWWDLGETTDTAGLDGDQLLLLAGSLIS
jgi:hypothetical protein